MSSETFEMIGYDLARTYVMFHFGPGAYIPQCESGVGKTYLGICLEEIRTKLMCPVAVYTYDDHLINVSIEDKLKNLGINEDDLEVLLVDRYDKYAGNYVDTINRLAEKAVVVIDSKRGGGQINYDLCDISFTEEGIDLV